MEYLIGEFNIHPDSNPQQPIFDENENVLGVVDFEGCTDPNQAAVLFGLGKLDFSEVKAVWFRGQFESYWYKEDNLGEVLRKLSNHFLHLSFLILRDTLLLLLLVLLLL